ncbi:MAG: ATP-binding protein, partial [Methanobacteriota archaeon]
GQIAEAIRTMVDQITKIIKDLQTSESRFRGLFNTATDAIFILEDDLILEANPAADILFSEQGVPLTGMGISDICPSVWEFIKDTKCSDPEYIPVFKDSSIYDKTGICESDISTGEGLGARRILNVRVIPLGIGEYPLLQVQIRDVTRRVEMEEAIHNLNTHLEIQVKERTAILEATISDLDSFTYTVSHDLRSPLRAIDGNAYILEMKGRGVIPPEFSKYITKIHNNIKRMDNLIDDLLKFSKMSRKPLEKIKINMNELVREVTDELIISESGHQTILNIDDLRVAYGDPALIRQVLVNLISNALKFGKKWTTNNINISTQTDDGRTWFVIQDTGIGFDVEFAHRIFEVFLQLHPAGDYEGTGVGLAIVKRIIFRHNGAIRVSSKEGVGSIFMFTVDPGAIGIFITGEEVKTIPPQEQEDGKNC